MLTCELSYPQETFISVQMIFQNPLKNPTDKQFYQSNLYLTQLPTYLLQQNQNQYRAGLSVDISCIILSNTHFPTQCKRSARIELKVKPSHSYPSSFSKIQSGISLKYSDTEYFNANISGEKKSMNEFTSIVHRGKKKSNDSHLIVIFIRKFHKQKTEAQMHISPAKERNFFLMLKTFQK